MLSIKGWKLISTPWKNLSAPSLFDSFHAHEREGLSVLQGNLISEERFSKDYSQAIRKLGERDLRLEAAIAVIACNRGILLQIATRVNRNRSRGAQESAC